MKTEINLSNFNFNSIFVRQIEDDNRGNIRIVRYLSHNFADHVERIYLNFEMLYIDPTTLEVIEEMTHKVKVEGKDWVVSNDRIVTLIDAQGNEIANPDYDDSQPVTDDNYPYKTGQEYERYKSFIFNPSLSFNPVPKVLEIAIKRNDAIGAFNKRQSNGLDW